MILGNSKSSRRSFLEWCKSLPLDHHLLGKFEFLNLFCPSFPLHSRWFSLFWISIDNIIAILFNLIHSTLSLTQFSLSQRKKEFWEWEEREVKRSRTEWYFVSTGFRETEKYVRRFEGFLNKLSFWKLKAIFKLICPKKTWFYFFGLQRKPDSLKERPQVISLFATKKHFSFLEILKQKMLAFELLRWRNSNWIDR